MRNLKYLISYAWKESRLLFIVILLKSLSEALLPLIDIIGIGVVINALLEGYSKGEIMNVILLFVGINLGVGIVNDTFALITDIVQRRATNTIQFRFAWHSLILNYHYIQNGSFQDLKRKSMKVQPSFYIQDFGRFFSFIVRFIGIAFIFFVIEPLVVIAIVMLSVIPIILSFRQKEAEFKTQNEIVSGERKNAYLYGTMTEYKYAKDIRIYQCQDYIRQMYAKISSEILKKLQKLSWKVTGIRIVSNFVSNIQTALLMIYYTYLVYVDKIALSEYSVLLSSTILFTTIIYSFFDTIARIRQICGFTGHLIDYHNLVAENSGIYESNKLPRVGLRDNFSITFDHVSFTYPDTDKVILEDICFHIKDGERIGLVGLNGAGKTTLMKLLLRIYEPTKGRILVNGININEIPMEEYAEKVGTVLQDYFVFSYSVLENLTFDNNTDMSRAEDSLRLADIKSRVDALPKGIHTSLFKNLDDDGVELSGGENQKIALARAIYKYAALMLLDEPTSALDPFAEAKLYDELTTVTRGKTTIIVSHRLSSTKSCDRIFVLQQGKIVESGTHEELIAQKGIYEELFQMQANLYGGGDSLGK